MTRSLRLLQPARARTPLRSSKATTALFWWGVFAIFLQFLLTQNLLEACGIHAQIKVHPASIIVLICVITMFLRGDVPLGRRFREAPGLMLYVFGIPLLGIYSIFFNGYTGSAVYIESFWSAGLLAIVLEPSTDRQKRLLAKILIGLCVFNALVGVFESLTYTNWFPLVLDPDLAEKIASTNVDFRANAFYAHPLTASLVTAMAIIQLYSMRLRYVYAAPIFGLLLIALLAFGGRTALGVTLVVSIFAAGYTFLSGILKRDLKLDFILSVATAAIIIPLIVFIVVTQTTIADRIMDTLYYDDSASVRATQWDVLNWLSLRNWLFGISMADLAVLKYQIGLGGVGTDIENFWLLVFLNVGSIGYVVFLSLFGGFLTHIARKTGSMMGWLLMLSALMIDSASNSLGVKSNDLFIETGFLMSMVGYKGFVQAPRLRRVNLVFAAKRAYSGIANAPSRLVNSGLSATSRGRRSVGEGQFSRPNIR